MQISIESPTDPRIDVYRAMTDAERLDRLGLFVAEGRLVVQRLLTASRFRATSVLVTPTALGALRATLDAVPDVPVFVAAQEVMNHIVGFPIHRGCVALGHREPDRQRFDAASASLVVAVEAIANADNIGSLFRSAAALGADGILLDGASADPLYRKAIRTSMGASLQLPFARAWDWPGMLHDLRRQGLTLLALTPAQDALPLGDVARSFDGRRVALVVGSEGEGLTRATLDACDVRVYIPMTTGIDSLNVATAAAIALYALHEQLRVAR